MKNTINWYCRVLGVLMFTAFLVAPSLASNAAVWAQQKPDEDPNHFQFAVVGDRTGGERRGVFQEILGKLNLMQPDFAVSVGDVIRGYTDDVETVRAQWDEFDAMMDDLSVPFLWAPGNHDITNEPMARLYEQRYGRPHYHVVYKDVLFLFINTSDPSAQMSEDVPQEVKDKLAQDGRELRRRIREEGHTDEVMEFFYDYEVRQREYNGAKITDAQGDYFEKVLNEHKDVRWTFVVMHNRVWKQKNQPDAWRRIERLLADRPYTVFGGHEHFHEHTVINGNSHIGVATIGGGWLWPLTKPGVYDHILWVTMEDERPIIVNILTDGIRDKTDIRPYAEGDIVLPRP